MTEQEKREILARFRADYKQQLMSQFGLSDFDAGYIVMFGIDAADDGLPWPNGLKDFVVDMETKRDALADSLDEPDPATKTPGPDLHQEAKTLRKNLPLWLRELRDDPEGCFGGRGNNFGEPFVCQAQERLAWLEQEGY